MVGNLKDPLKNYYLTIEELKGNILPYVEQKNGGDSWKFYKQGFKTIQWAAFGGKKRVNDTAHRSLQNKMTLDSSMGLICT